MAPVRLWAKTEDEAASTTSRTARVRLMAFILRSPLADGRLDRLLVVADRVEGVPAPCDHEDDGGDAGGRAEEGARPARRGSRGILRERTRGRCLGGHARGGGGGQGPLAGGLRAARARGGCGAGRRS